MITIPPNKIQRHILLCRRFADQQPSAATSIDDSTAAPIRANKTVDNKQFQYQRDVCDSPPFDVRGCISGDDDCRTNHHA
eukprot:scaffold392013_cov24-Prasinocladus_malaysianus.AAC.1